MPEGFGARRERTAAEQAELERRLHEQIGRLETEPDWLKKKWGLSLEERRALIGPHPGLSLRRQCQLLRLHRSGLFYVPAPVSAREPDLRARLDRIYTAHPEYGVGRRLLALAEERRVVNSKCVRRLLREMGLEAVYPKPRITIPGPQAGRFPYLLRGLIIERPHQVSAADITYIRRLDVSAGDDGLVEPLRAGRVRAARSEETSSRRSLTCEPVPRRTERSVAWRSTISHRNCARG